MIVHVSLLRYGSKVFTYTVPDSLQTLVSVGSLVYVPLQKRMVVGVVCSIDLVPRELYSFALKEISSIFQLPDDQYYELFLKKVAYFYQIDYLVLLKRLEFFLLESEEKKTPVPYVATISDSVVSFTHEQAIAYAAIAESLQNDKKQTFLLHGVTGSGKTEVYKKLIADAIAAHKSVIVMLPEVSLALRFEQIFKNSLNNIEIFSFHSATSTTQKRLLWDRLIEKKPILILGVHLPILLPIYRLGLVIIDEEHDAGYQEKQFPFLHSKDMALLKADLAGAVVVLGSATPSVTTWYNANTKGWPVLALKNRYAGSFPTVKTVSLKQAFIDHKSWFSSELLNAIADRLSKREQVIIFLNRRGYSFFVQCTCGVVFSCNACSVSLTLHQDQTLRCHYCASVQQVPARCYSCNAHQDTFLKKGIGTQQVVQQLMKLFPTAVVARADLDTTSKKRSWSHTVADMLDGSIDILVGTQSITKGYHFPKVTLVGIIWADLNVHFPVYNATEVALQQLIQVAGRAGRQSNDSLVIVQAFDHHPIFEFLDEHKYPLFVQQELEKRSAFRYPPIAHIAHITLQSNNEAIVWRDARYCKIIIDQLLADNQSNVIALGPTESILYKLKGQFSLVIMLKASTRLELIRAYQLVRQKNIASSISFLIDPV